MLSCEQLSQNDLLLLHNLILQQQEEVAVLKKHISLLLDDMDLFNYYKRTSVTTTKLAVELKNDNDKLKQDNVKLRNMLDKDREINFLPGQRKFTSQQSLALPHRSPNKRGKPPPHSGSKPKGDLSRSSPVLFDQRRNTINTTTRDIVKVKTMDDSQLSNFVSPVSHSPNEFSTPLTMPRSATLQRPATTSNTPNSIQNRQRNKGIFSSVGKAMHRVRLGSKSRKSVSDPNLSALDNSSVNSDASKSTWIRNLFGTTSLRVKSPGYDGDSLMSSDTQRSLFPCMLGINTLDEVLSKQELEEANFPNWDTIQLHQWLDTQGLGIFGQKLPAGWTGSDLLKLDVGGLEKTLGIKNPLHIKKLVLALRHAGNDDAAGQLSCDTWVLPWLGEIGLEQYVPAFRSAMVDGRMLNWLTYQDLSLLHVRIRLHAVSIMRSVELLRECDFNPKFLNHGRIDNTNRPAEVLHWTHQNIKQWLAAVNLAEFTPALKSTGIHGALIVKEPLITSTFLINLLHIPHDKPVYRKLFETSFNTLIGPHILLEKRLSETNKDVKPLSVQGKISKSFRARRSFSQSLTRRGRKKSAEWLTFVVPFDKDQDMLDQSIATPDLSVRAEKEISGIQKEVENLTILLSSPETEDQEEIS